MNCLSSRLHPQRKFWKLGLRCLAGRIIVSIRRASLAKGRATLGVEGLLLFLSGNATAPRLGVLLRAHIEAQRVDYLLGALEKGACAREGVLLTAPVTAAGSSLSTGGVEPGTGSGICMPFLPAPQPTLVAQRSADAWLLAPLPGGTPHHPLSWPAPLPGAPPRHPQEVSRSTWRWTTRRRSGHLC